MKLICPGKVSAVTCSPDGKYCVAACAERIYIWQVMCVCVCVCVCVCEA